MATIATTRKRARFGRKWLIGIGVVIVLIVGALLVLPRGNVGTAATATPGWQTVAASTGTIDAAVSATGNIEAQAQADLRFAADGLVTAIVVKPGDKVQANQPLARVDDVDLKLRVEQ